MTEHCKLVPVELLDRFPEINPSNYGPDDVEALNAWGIEVALSAVPEQPSFTVDDLAQEIRRIDGKHDLGTAALAEKLFEFIARKHPSPPNEWNERDELLELIHLKFQSSNESPVEQITLTRAELNDTFPELLK